MSLNDSAYTSTPTIVRDAGRFVSLVVSGATSLNSLGVAGATTLNGTLEVNEVATFDAAANFNQAVTIGTSVMTTATINSLLYAANGGTIGASSSSTLTVNSSVTQAGPFTVASGMDRTTTAAEPTATSLTLTWNTTPNLVSIIASANGLIMTMSAAGSPPDGVLKIIKNSYQSGYAINVRDGATAEILSVLDPGEECTVFWSTSAARWY